MYIYFSYICICNKEVMKQNSKGTSIFYIFKYFAHCERVKTAFFIHGLGSNELSGSEPVRGVIRALQTPMMLLLAKMAMLI